MDQAVTDHLRERLIDYIAHLHVPKVRPVDGVVAISAESMADALLPFVREEMENRPPTQWAYDAACAALHRWRDRARKLEEQMADLYEDDESIEKIREIRRRPPDFVTAPPRGAAAALAEAPQEFCCISCGGLDPRCGAHHPEYGFTCILPDPHSGPHYDTAGGHWDPRGQLELDRCNPSTGYHSSPHRGCILR